MILFLTLIVAATAFTKEGLKADLQSTKGQIKLFNQWVSHEHANYGVEEKRFRFRVFQKHLKEIVEINNAQDDYELDINFMAGLTEEEQQQYYGINITAEVQEADAEEESRLLDLPTSGSVDWREEGKITAVQRQKISLERTCGCCWAFAGVAAFEGHYAIKTGNLKRFSEQEFVDCTYEGESDGCKGGWYWHAFDMVKRTQHLAADSDYQYTAQDGRCLTSSKPNGMKDAKIIETVRPKKSRKDATLVQALNIGPVAMAFEVKGGFNYYRSGVLSILYDCGRVSDHAMAVTGYTPQYFEMKNSFGIYWGEWGYVRFNRQIENMCGISNWLAYPKLQKIDDDVEPTKDDDADDDATCVDKDASCPGLADRGDCSSNRRYMASNCRKSCGLCGCSDAAGYERECPVWMEAGYCTLAGHHEEWMTANCPKSCGKCTEE